jgi:hypothetical protein
MTKQTLSEKIIEDLYDVDLHRIPPYIDVEDIKLFIKKLKEEIDAELKVCNEHKENSITQAVRVILMGMKIRIDKLAGDALTK